MEYHEKERASTPEGKHALYPSLPCRELQLVRLRVRTIKKPIQQTIHIHRICLCYGTYDTA